MTRTKGRNPHVEFAESHSPSPYSTLNAFSALQRCDNLLNDLDILEQLKIEGQKKGMEFGVGWFGFEIITYYLVAFATCLEWHARSRLVDLLTFKPECAEPADIKPIGADTLVQSIGAKVTVAHLLGAMTQVTSFDKYCAILSRVFEVIGAKPHPKKLASKLDESPEGKVIAKAAAQNSVDDVLTELFVSRHDLVHEINLGTIGPYTLRNNLDIEFARAYGQATKLMIVHIEKAITEAGPEDFPNLLDEAGYPINEYQKLELVLLQAEAHLTERIRADEAKEVANLWEVSLNAYKAHKNAQEALLEEARFVAPTRYFSARDEMKIELLRQRVLYLKKLQEEVPGITTESEDELDSSGSG